MAHPQIAVFARLADKNARPLRKIEGHKTMMGRTMHGIAYDPVHDEIFVPQPFAQTIIVFRGDAAGDQPPLRYIQGPLTRLENPDKLEIDPVHNELFVPEGDVILVFDRSANGNVAPKRVMKMPQEVSVDAVAVDYVNDIVIATNPGGSPEQEYPRLLFFSRTAAGDVKPLRAVGGPKTMITGTFGLRALPESGVVLLAMNGPTTTFHNDESFVGVWSNLHDNGDVAPRWTIGGPYGALKQPRGVDLDRANKSVIISDKVLNSVFTYYFPEIF